MYSTLYLTYRVQLLSLNCCGTVSDQHGLGWGPVAALRWRFRPRRSAFRPMHSAYCYTCSVVYLSSCVLLVTSVSPTKTAEPIEMLFGVWARRAQGTT